MNDNTKNNNGDRSNELIQKFINAKRKNKDYSARVQSAKKEADEKAGALAEENNMLEKEIEKTRQQQSNQIANLSSQLTSQFQQGMQQMQLQNQVAMMEIQNQMLSASIGAAGGATQGIASQPSTMNLEQSGANMMGANGLSDPSMQQGQGQTDNLNSAQAPTSQGSQGEVNHNTGEWHERSGTYKGQKFEGFYEGNDDPEFVIDIGHDPKKSNAATPDGVGEYWVNRDLAIKTAKELNARGIKCGILERKEGAKKIDTNFVNSNFKGAKLVELHNDGEDSGLSSLNGVSALKGVQDGDNALASSMIKNISAATGMKVFNENGSKGGLRSMKNGKGGAFVKDLPNVDNALIEIGFLTNRGDVEKIQESNGYNMVLGITNGLLESKGLNKIDSLVSMQKTDAKTQYSNAKGEESEKKDKKDSKGSRKSGRKR